MKLALSTDVRMSNYYWVYFLAIGSFAPFSALWLDSLEISSTMSGAIFAAPSIATVIFTVFIGRWADRLKDWRSAIIACNWIALTVICWLLFRQEPWDLLIVWTLAGLFIRASGPIMDAAALNSTRITQGNFGRIRSFGSMGFIAGVLLAGYLFDHFGIGWFVTVLILGAAARVVAAHVLPAFKTDGHLNSLHSQSTFESGPSFFVIRHPGILMVLLGSALLNASHGFNNVFSVMHWTNVDISTGMASVLWSVGVIAEVALMWSFKSVAEMFSARKCLLLASAVSIARWFLTGTDPSLYQLFVLQALHSITYGLTFIATVSFIAKRVDEDHAAQAQSVYAMMMTLFMALAIWSSGWLYDQFAGRSYWSMSIIALVGGLSIAFSFRTNLDDAVAAK